MATKTVAFKHLDEDVSERPFSPHIPEKAPKPKNRTTQMRFGNQSIWARMAFHPYFESTTMAVIVFNALWIGADTEWNHESLKVDGKLPLEPVSTAIENFFCVYFTIELTIRFLAFAEKKKCVYDMWFVFDGTLVACMIFETWVMVIVAAAMNQDGGAGVGPLSALRLLRLLRLARMGRLMKFVPEMGNLVKGMIRAARSVVFILIFLVLVIYVFSIIFTASLGDRQTFPLTPRCDSLNETEVEGIYEEGGCIAEGEFGPLGQDLFASMGDSFMTLFTRGVLGDNLDETVVAIMDESLILMWLFFVFFAITSATLLNMLIGVVCEVISDSSAEEEEAATVNGLTFTIQEAFAEIDANEDGLVTQNEWAHIKDNEAVRKSMSSIGIEEERMEERLKQMEEMLFIEDQDENEEPPKLGHCGSRDSVGLTVGQLIDRVVQIRPDQDASALDLELLNAKVTKDQKLFMNKLFKFEKGFAKIEKALGGQLLEANTSIATPTENSANTASLSNQRGSNESRPDISALANVSTEMLFQSLKEQNRAPAQAPIHR